jgi:dethiobiotin synthetase
MKPFRVFVAGTDTGVGKTQVAGALLSLLADRGDRPAPFKPYETGIPRGGLPADAVELQTAAQSTDDLRLICPHRFRDPLAPAVAAEREKREPDFAETLAAFASFAGRALVAEAAGGLRVPIDARHDNLDLIRTLRLPVLLVARAGLGTLNHTALSLDALRARRIPVQAVVLVRGAGKKDPSERDNPRIIESRFHARVLGPVPFVENPLRRRAAFRRALRPLLAS